MSAIEIKNVTYIYNEGLEDEVLAIDNLSLSLNEGEFVALVGHNGSGKSTVARLLNGLLIPNSGEVIVFNKSTAIKKNLFDIRSQLGVVFQNPDNQMVATIIEDDVAFGPENLGLKPELIRKRVDEALKNVRMYDYREGAGHRLSGGQKQRVAIAGVLALNPKIMVLDEATSMLDPISRGEVLSVISELIKNQGLTVIMITHFMEEASLADRIVVMKDGKSILDDKPRNVFTQIEVLESAGLELPPPTLIANNLFKMGIEIKKDILSSEELCDELAKLKQKGNKK